MIVDELLEFTVYLEVRHDKCALTPTLFKRGRLIPLTARTDSAISPLYPNRLIVGVSHRTSVNYQKLISGSLSAVSSCLATQNY